MLVSSGSQINSNLDYALVHLITCRAFLFDSSTSAVSTSYWAGQAGCPSSSTVEAVTVDDYPDGMSYLSYCLEFEKALHGETRWVPDHCPLKNKCDISRLMSDFHVYDARDTDITATLTLDQ